MEFYWNKPNFDGLRALADELASDADLAELAQYARLRERGLRKDAFTVLDAFLNAAKAWQPDRARNAAVRVLECHARTPEAHQFLAHPLLEQFIVPVLEEWMNADPDAVAPVRWLGWLRSDHSLLERALLGDPTDLPVRRRLIDLELSGVDYACHHLHEGHFLGELADAQEGIANARKWLRDAPSAAQLEDLASETEHYSQLLADWVEYKSSPRGSFVEWCQSRGRAYRWPTTVYYGTSADDGSRKGNDDE